MNVNTQNILLAKYQGKSFSKVAADLGVTKDKAQKLARHYRTEFEQLQPLTIPAKMRLTGDAVVLGDLHCSYVNWDILEKACEIGMRCGIKNVIIAGDALNLDALSVYPALLSQEPVGNELRTCGKAFRMLLSAFEHLSWFRGNHDFRAIKANSWIDMSDLVALMLNKSKDESSEDIDLLSKRISVSMHDSMTLVNGEREWLVCHQEDYSPNRLTVAQKLSEINECSVLTHHQHHQGYTISKNGRHIVADNGCCCDFMPYVSMNTSKHTRWVRGFSVFANGTFEQYYHDFPIGIK